MSELEGDVVYLESILRPLLAFPNDLEVWRNVDERGVYIVIRMNQEDMGRAIGKNGNTSQAIRQLLRQFGLSSNPQSLISLKIEEPPGSKRKFKEAVAKEDE